MKSFNTGCFQTGKLVSEEGEENVIGADSHFHPNTLIQWARRSLTEVLKNGDMKLDPVIECLALPNIQSWT